MTIATITTDINIGPFKIPANGQNMITNNYAQRNNLAVELAIPEPLKSNALATVQWLHKERKLSKIILTSIHQLPIKKNELEELVDNMENVEFHFALEGISGKGKNFLIEAIKEAKIFMKSQSIESIETTWLDLYKIMKNS
jgi:sporadic carbohydrate cluster protein (TIGR04323 family)|tara:strand:+ start:141 stop:563 length:423 start_codon:yes stop_codon:yes gene_type:complete